MHSQGVTEIVKYMLITVYACVPLFVPPSTLCIVPLSDANSLGPIFNHMVFAIAVKS